MHIDVCFTAITGADPGHFRLRRGRSPRWMNSNNGDHSNNLVLHSGGAWPFPHHPFHSNTSLRYLVWARTVGLPPCVSTGLWEPLLLPSLVLASHGYLVVFTQGSPFILHPGFPGWCLHSDSFLIALPLPEWLRVWISGGFLSPVAKLL